MGETYEHARDSEETRHFRRYPLLPALTFGATLSFLRYALEFQLSVVGLVLKFGVFKVIRRERLELELDVRRLTYYASETLFLGKRI